MNKSILPENTLVAPDVFSPTESNTKHHFLNAFLRIFFVNAIYHVGDKVIHYYFDIIFPKEYQPPGVSTEMSCVEALTTCVTEKRKTCPKDVLKYFIAKK